MIKALIFDCDGLLIDTETPWFHAVETLYKKHGQTITLEDYLQSVGGSLDAYNPYEQLKKLLDEPVEVRDLIEAASQTQRELMEKETLRPGVKDYLMAAKEMGLKIGVASSSDEEWVRKHLQDENIYELFDQILTADDVSQVKPDPELYIKSLAGFGIKPNEAVIFEDSLNGLKAAQAAGTPCVIVPNTITKTLTFTGQIKMIQSMADVPLKHLLAEIQELTKNN